MLRSIYHIARADFLERIRQYSFLLLMVATVYLSYVFVPPVGAAYQTVALGDARGVYNSPWMGTMFGILISCLVTLIVFYVLKNAIERDRRTQVGQIIAATPIRKSTYVLGKWISHLMLLIVLLVVMTIMSAILQIVRAEDIRLDLAALALPLWLVGFPALALVAGLAVLFETIPLLRGGLGNVLFFFLFMFVLILFIEGSENPDGLMQPSFEPFGISYPLADMQQTILEIDPSYAGDVIIGGAELSQDPLIFLWDGIRMNSEWVLARLSWVAIAGLLALLAALPFDRFDPARMRSRKRKGTEDETPLPDSVSPGQIEGRTVTVLTPFKRRFYRSRFLQVVYSEWLLMIKGRKLWWLAVAAGLSAVQFAVLDESIRGFLLAAAWLWPVLLWSAMGNREKLYDTRQILFSTPHPLLRQFAAQWLAGVLLAALTGAGFGLRIMLAARWDALFAWCAAVVFIPSLALALGALSGSSRAFEVVYTFLWYIGPINGFPALDYTGITSQALQQGVARGYLLAAGGLVVLAFFGRWRQMKQ